MQNTRGHTRQRKSRKRLLAILEKWVRLIYGRMSVVSGLIVGTYGRAMSQGTSSACFVDDVAIVVE